MSFLKTMQKPMTMADIKDKAKNLGINPADMKKTDLIRAIQQAEGYATCYGTSQGTCQWTNCCFRPDCLKIRK
ncbi:MAG: Rho termination factor N-terminal domain-containing protein [Sedimentisphaerales bacterium]|jgi:predicted metal-binding transcription factor (methanogenesis marker protein 9)